MNYTILGLGIAGFIILGLGMLTLTGWVEYQAARDHHRNTTISNDHVENLPWSLLSDQAKEDLE